MDGTVARTRISDPERTACDERLRDAVGQGLLTLAEYEQRAGELWRAQTQGDLVHLTADLPAVVAEPVRGPWSRRKTLAVVVAVVVGLGTLIGFRTIAGTAGNVGDRLVFVPEGASEYEVPSGVGNVTVVVPDDVVVEPIMTGVGNLSCTSACTRQGSQDLRLTFDGVGNLEVKTVEEHEGPR